MATYRKLDRRIWRDQAFSRLNTQAKLDAIQSIVLNQFDGDFFKYAGPRFRVANDDRRRPDLYTMAWKKLRLQIIAEQGTTCTYCGKDCSSDPTVDHCNPVCAGEVDPMEASNLVVCCRSCNSKKGGREGW